MSPEAERFLQEKVRSHLKLEIILYFHHNPFTMDYAEGTAMRLGLHPALVSEALEQLAAAGVLHKRESQFAPTRPSVYSYMRDPALRAMVTQIDGLMDETGGRAGVFSLLQCTEDQPS